jgi:dihydroorotate dehydrogenase electron transfer subunit
MKQVLAEVVSTTEVIPDTRLIRLDAPEITTTAKPGQFVMLYCGEDTLLRRPISVHRVDGDRLALLVAAVGKGTRWLSERKKGEKIDIFGPLGNGFTIHPETDNLLLVAGGIGIAPLVFLADTALASGKKVTFITGARSADCLLPISSPQQLYDGGMMAASMHVINATEDGSEGFKGMATDLIPHYLEGIDQVCACGPEAMYGTMARMPELEGKPVQVSLEIMMGCGMGVCYGCTIKTKKGLRQVCKDGPVFEMGEVEWRESSLSWE